MNTLVIFAQDEYYEVKRIKGINTSSLDFSPIFYKEGLIFCRAVGSWVDATESSKQVDYFFVEDKFAIYSDSLFVVQEIPFSNNLNNSDHQGPATFYNDTVIYFTSSRGENKDYVGRDYKKRFRQLSLKKSKRIRGSLDWSDPEEVLSATDVSIGHPTISLDQSYIIVVSDLDVDNKGETDLYISYFDEEGRLGELINLGDYVNTKGKELFPFIAQNGKLYYASNGFGDAKNFDIYSVSLDLGEDNIIRHDPERLLEPLNSSKDDFSFILDKKGINGFISSNRDGGIGEDDIYLIRKTDKPPVQIKKHSFEEKKKSMVDLQSPLLSEINPLSSSDSLSSEPYPVAKEEPDGNDAIDSSEPLKLRHIEDVDVLYLKLADETLLPIRREKLPNSLKISIVDGKPVIVINSVFYDLNTEMIDKEEKKKLNQVISVMEADEGVKLEIFAYADAHGVSQYNEKLSQIRANGVKKYILNYSDISSSRIVTARGLGKDILLNDCSDPKKCTEKQNAINRRTEFIFIK